MAPLFGPPRSYKFHYVPMTASSLYQRILRGDATSDCGKNRFRAGSEFSERPRELSTTNGGVTN